MERKEGPGNGIDREYFHGYTGSFEDSEEGTQRMNPEPDDCTDEVDAAKKKIQWKWWIITVLVAVLGAGFYASQFLSNSFVRRDNYLRDREENRAEHLRIGQKIQTFEQTLTGVRIEQAQDTERSKLIDARLKLLLERTEDEPRTPRERSKADRQERDLQKTIDEQERRLRRLENDPRVKQVKGSDPLGDLSF